MVSRDFYIWYYSWRRRLMRLYYTLDCPEKKTPLHKILLVCFVLPWFLCMTIGVVSIHAELLYPRDLVYKGAFRMPRLWAALRIGAVGYCPKGDSNGPNDGYPGSLYLYQQYAVGEVSIPAPVISATKCFDSLPVASVTALPVNILPPGYTPTDQERVGDVCYLPAQGSQNKAKMHITWPKYWEYNDGHSHGWFDLDLSNPAPTSLWNIANFPNTRTAGYMCEIPSDWADSNVQGMNLATGRYRWGQGSDSRGPNLYACAPWAWGNPPSFDADVPAVELLHYPESNAWPSYSGISAGWSMAEWLTAGHKTAVIIAGGNCDSTWYGTDPECGRTQGPQGRRCKTEILFYSPEDLASVAKKEKAPNLAPYAIWDVRDFLFTNPDAICFQSPIDGGSYDRERGLVYILEGKSNDGWDNKKPIVHVFSIMDPALSEKRNDNNTRSISITAFPNPFNPLTVIKIQGLDVNDPDIELGVYNTRGKLIQQFIAGFSQRTAGFVWNARDLASGLYLLRVKEQKVIYEKSLLLIK